MNEADRGIICQEVKRKVEITITHDVEKDGFLFLCYLCESNIRSSNINCM